MGRGFAQGAMFEVVGVGGGLAVGEGFFFWFLGGAALFEVFFEAEAGGEFVF